MILKDKKIINDYKEELSMYVRKYNNIFSKLESYCVLVTGACGLIGSYLIDLLSEYNSQTSNDKIKIIAVDRDKSLMDLRFPDELFKNDWMEKVNIDINNEDITLAADYVIHAASNTSPIDYATKPIDTISTNIIGTKNMLNYCVRNKIKKFVFCSSVEVYGANNGDVDEFSEEYSGFVNSNTLRAGYPSAKRCAEALCNAYETEYTDFDFAIARIGRIYGPTVISGDAKAPTQFIMNAVNGNDIVLKSDGMQEFSYAYVGDCATAIIYILENGKNGEAYNIADPNSRLRLKEFAELAAKNGKRRVVFEKQKNIEQKGYSKITKAVMNTDKIIELGWKPLIGADDGVRRTVKYLKEMMG